MTGRLFFLISLLSVVAAARCHGQEVGRYLVRDGKPCSVIVSPLRPSEPIQWAIDELRYHVLRASGADLPIVGEQEAESLPDEVVRIAIGVEKFSSQLGVDATKLPIDAFRVKSAGNVLVFVGHDSRTSYGSTTGRWNAATMWAVDHFLDTQLGVRWLWPGETGTYLPRRADIPLPEIDFIGRPRLETRQLAARFSERTLNGTPQILTTEEFEQLFDEASAWMRRFQMGSRSTLKFGHAFTTWWEKYGTTHPEYFAIQPSGSPSRQPWPGTKGVKLRIGNEAVDDAIIAEWKSAGAPNSWNVCPNDGVGFDTGDESRALDDPPEQNPELIWRTSEANLTARYVKFWNRLISKMRKINEDVTLTSYAYSAYRNPPINGLKLEPGIILETVPSYWAEDDWLRWRNAGATLFLRPNWWHSGAVAPVIPLHREGNFFKFAQEHGMAGFKFDSLHGFWGTRGAQYYLIARLSVRPDLTVDEVIDEYCSAFGEAAAVIKEYLAYWEQFTEEAAYPVAAGGTVRQPHTGLYDKLLQENGLGIHPLAGSWTVVPLLYTDAVLDRGYEILDRAARLAAGDDVDVRQRVQFLRSGLDHLKLTRDVLRLGYIKKRTSEQQSEYERLADDLQQMRHGLTLQHVVWGEVVNVYEARRGAAPTVPAARTKKENLDGK